MADMRFKRAAVHRDQSHVKTFKTMQREQRLQRLQRVVTQVLVINLIESGVFDHAAEIDRLDAEYAVLLQ